MGCKILSKENNHYVIKHANYNAIIKPGQTLTLGFGGSPGKVNTTPSNYQMSAYELKPSGTIEQAPSVQITAVQENIKYGETTQLIWESLDADQVTIEPGIGTVDLNGTITIQPQETTTYTITGTRKGTNLVATSLVTVIVTPISRPTIQFEATPQVIQRGEAVQLQWFTQGGTVAHMDQGIGSVPLDGTITITPQKTTTYTLTVTGEVGSSNAQVLVTVLGNVKPQPEGSYGYQYNDLIPEDATISSYDDKRFSLITGSVQDIYQMPLEGVAINVYNHPEYGTVYTDGEGHFTIPVEGGGDLTIQYTKNSYISSQRTIYVPWNDTGIMEPIQMITLDTKSTNVVFDHNHSTVITHRSTPVTDQYGTRSMSMVFRGDNRAWLVDENGNDVYPLDNITVRATEFTTIDSMPAVLPSTTAYTYCAELQVDGAERVRFEKPITTWVENFLDFPVGEIVPAGYFDRERNVWVPSKNGIVVMLLDTNGDGIVDALDSDGDGIADIVDPLELSGLEDASIYQPGSTFWKVDITHFTPWDYNWPFGPPSDAVAPNPEGVPQVQDNLVFYDDIAIPGTNNMLHYSSDRVEGYHTIFTVPIGEGTLPESLQSIVVELRIAGRIYRQTFSPQPGQIAEFSWDGLDHLGRRCDRVVSAKVSVGYVYPSVFYRSNAEYDNAFAMAGSAPMERSDTRQTITIWNHTNLDVNTNTRKDHFGEGWTLSSQHQLILGKNPAVLKGDGSKVSYSGILYSEVLTYFDDVYDYNQDQFGRYPNGVANDAYGNLYVVTDNRVVKIDLEGNKTVIAGNGDSGYYGDGGPAIHAAFDDPQGIAVDNEGNIYIADTYNSRIRKVDTQGIITTIAGNVRIDEGYLRGRSSNEQIAIGDNGDAKNAQLFYPYDVAVDSYGNIFIADANNNRVRKISPNGIITTVAGDGTSSFHGDNGPATEAGLDYPKGIACDSKGNLYILDSGNLRIRRVEQSGLITTVAGNGTDEYVDGVAATETGFIYPSEVAVDALGNLYIIDSHLNIIAKVFSDGVITTIVGTGEPDETVPTSISPDVSLMSTSNELPEDEVLQKVKEGGSALKTRLRRPSGLAIDSTGNLYYTESWGNRVSKATLPNPFLSNLAEDAAHAFVDGDELYTFSPSGIHQKTIDLATGVILLEYQYNNQNQLIAVTDHLGNKVSIERDSSGKPNAIVSPYGIRTELTIDNNRLKEVTYANGANFGYVYTELGLLTQIIDSKSNVYYSNYHSNGRLRSILDSEGGHWNYERTLLPNGMNITTIISAEGLVTTYYENETFSGAYHATIREPNGATTIQNHAASKLGLQEFMPDGTSLTYQYDLDPLYYTQYTDTIKYNTPFGGDITLQNGITYEDTNQDGRPDLITNTNDEDGRITTTIHNILEGTITTTTAENRTSKISYHPDTLLLEREELPGLNDTSYEYDNRGKLRILTTGSRTTQFQYNQEGFLSNVITPDQKEARYEYDPIGQVTAIHRPDGSSIYQEYDSNGNLTKLKTPGRAEYTYDYNKVNSTVSYQTPISGEYRYTYNKDRQMTTMTSPEDKKTTYLYDKGQLVQVDTPEGDTIYLEYLDDYLLDKITKKDQSISYEYVGSMITKDTRRGILDTTLEFTYNEDLELETFSYAGNSEGYTYDKDGLLTKAGRYTLTRNPENGLLTSTNDGKIAVGRSYSGYGELESNSYQIGNKTPMTWSVVRNDAGKITEKTEVLNGVRTTYGYTYDDLGRLLTVMKNGSLVEQYGYDAVGRRISETNQLRNITSRNYSYNEEDQLLTSGNATYTYDLDGYLSKKTVRAKETTYQYSSSGELLSVALPDGKVIEYLHDALGRRAAKLVDGSVTEKYLWADDNITLLAVYDGNDNLKIRFEYAEDLRPVSMVKDGVTYYLSYDQVNSLRAVLDTEGNIVKQIEYDSFGNIINDTNKTFEIPLGFAGGYHDRDTGLVRFGARDYDPDTGRWTAKDPMSFSGGDTDLYGYCFMDPVNLVDVNGCRAYAQTAQDLLEVLFPSLITLKLAGAALLAKVAALIISIAPYLIIGVAIVAALVVGYYLIRMDKDKGAEKTNEKGVGGKGWRGDKTWKKNVKEVGEGGTIKDLNGQVPTQEEAEALIKESGGKVNRVEGPHESPNPHDYNHINYTTPSGGKGTIRIKL